MAGRSPERAAKTGGRRTKQELLAEVEGLRKSLVRIEKQSTRLRAERNSLLLCSEMCNSAGQAMAYVDSRGLIVKANPALSQLTGYEVEDMLGQNVRMLAAEAKFETGAVDRLLAALAKDGSWHGELWGRTPKGAVYPVWMNINSIRTRAGRIKGYTCSAVDITTLKKNEQQLQHMAHYDMLTNLPNRTLMQDRLKQAITMARRNDYPVAVMLLDLDRFKDINDTLGHHIGDLLLVEVASRLTSVVRESDTVSRLGGDEFLVILPDVGSAMNASYIAQKILEIISQPYNISGHEFFTSASIGIAMYPTDSRDPDTLQKNADTAMYHAKAQGKNNSKFFTEDINKSTIERFVLENRFRRALDKLEFHLNYQPKVDIRTGDITGMEALLRWYHPEQGSVKPALFIPLAEETGLVVPLGEWALREACRQCREWHDQGMEGLRLSVNLSARQFKKRDLIAMVSEVLNETKLDPSRLMLEITETTIIEDIQGTIATLNKFREMGVGVSVDDFGTGYSSLNYLNRFSIDELKIDGSFIADMDSSENRKIVLAIIALGRGLKHKVVAEGVETVEQLRFLRESECNEVQGYFFSKPLSAEEFHALLRKGGAYDMDEALAGRIRLVRPG